jgi:hypothetical protein
VVFLLNNLRAADRGVYTATAADRGICTDTAASERWIYAAVAAAATMLTVFLLDLNYPDLVNLVEIISLLRFHTTSDIHHNTIASDLAWESSCV